ncbi:MAG TPA: ribose-5-phosphate isomerase RpiA [Stellaceae bacterium]|jgi:ribose 5-phosphate isomerase A|nr:ribose-5-phosphate isomerase RpiA [Stellaceae bacterium]
MTDPMQELKRQVAEKAVEAVESGMIVGLGTGSTATLMVDAIGRRQREEGLKITGVPTSEATAAQARGLGIPLADFSTVTAIDVTIDGADAVDLKDLALIKGLGGALLREKIVAASSKRMIVITDGSKLEGRFGERVPVPVEVTRFGWQATERRLTEFGCKTVLRQAKDGSGPFVTDGGNYIIDCHFGFIADPAGLDTKLHHVVGVVETGLFIGLAKQVIVADAQRGLFIKP